ncbi:MAG: type II toxin-antitoxin system VapC family toxin [Candidatus Brocadiia bacterium]
MSDFVVDNSVVMTWAFEDESADYADAVLESLEISEAVVPAIWRLEVANVLVCAERIGRLQSTDTLKFLELIGQLPIVLCETRTSIRNVIDIARETGLSAYDASYLDLAIARNLPLATLDAKLRKAAASAGVDLWLEG